MAACRRPGKPEEPMPKTEGKHTDAVWSRVDAVVVLILENERYLQSKRGSELAKVVAEKFHVNPRTAKRYIKEARLEINKIGKADKKKAFIRAIRDREFLLQKAKSDSDYKLALEIIRDREKLHGLYVDEVKHTGEIALKDINLSSLTDDQLSKLKTMLKNKVPLKDALLHVGVIIK
jgi:hypothetical protein